MSFNFFTQIRKINPTRLEVLEIKCNSSKHAKIAKCQNVRFYKKKTVIISFLKRESGRLKRFWSSSKGHMRLKRS